MQPDRIRRLLCFGALLVLAVMVFRAGLPADRTILASDFNFSNLAVYKRIFPEDLLHGSWTSANLLGIQGMRALNLTNLLIAAVPLTVFTDWSYPFYLVVASWFFVLFLRRRGLDPMSALFGALTAFWTGSNLTLVYAGHLYKYGVLAFGSMSLYALERAVTGGGIAWSILAGGAAGMMFLEQQDLAVFYALLLALYAVHALWREHRAAPGGQRAAQVARVILPAALVAGLLMVDPYLRARNGIIDSATITNADPQAKWDWATQWSWPPEESLDFIAPGYTGLRTGEPQAPYWGRMGRSPGWEQTHQGFGNFKLESQYLGVIPVCFMLVALLYARRLRAVDPQAAGAITFWTAAGILLFALSCGRHLPVYRLFYALPQMSSIRNPNKFLQVMQVAWGVLAAYGFEIAWRSLRDRLSASGSAWMRPALIGAAALAGLLAMALLTSAASSTPGESVVALGLGPLAEAIRSQKVGAALHGLAFLGAAVAVLVLSGRAGPTWTRLRPRLAGAVIFLTALDILLFSRPYIVAKDIRETVQNPVAAWLAQAGGASRVHAPDQSGIYGYIIANDFPYHGVQYANLLAAPRLPREYDAFLKAVGGNLPRFWDLFGVRHVLVAAPLWTRLQGRPDFNALLEPVLGWSAVPKGPDSVACTINAPGQPAQHLVLRLRRGGERATFLPAWKIGSDEHVLAALADPAQDVTLTQWISSDTAQDLPPSPPAGPAAVAGKVEKQVNDLIVSLRTTAPGILRLADKYSPSLRVEINGKPAPLRRCHYLFPAVFLPEAGEFTIRFHYQPDRTGLFLVFAGLLTCAGAGALLAVARFRRPAAA